MGKKTLKGAALAALLGVVFQCGGCNFGGFKYLAYLLPSTCGMVSALWYDLLLDNDAIYDLVESGNTAGDNND